MKSKFATFTLLIFAGYGYAGDSSNIAMTILKKMTTTLESAQSLSVQGVATVDEIEPADDFKVQKTFTIDLRFKRPDKLFATKSGDENQRAGHALQIPDYHPKPGPGSSV